VDDDPLDVLFIRETFAQLSLINPLIVVGTMVQAQQKLADVLPALIISDVYLPGPSGIDFLQWLRGQRASLARVPVIILSGSTERIHEIVASSLNALLFLRKPTTGSTLIDAVRSLGLVVSRRVEGHRVGVVVQPSRLAAVAKPSRSSRA
jgi:DNA-binding response OmpR family regulator